MTLKRGLLQILLAALLLTAQYTAVTHGLRHWQQPAQLAQSQQEEGGKQKSQSPLCDYHVAFAEILGAVASSALLIVIADQAIERTVAPLADTRTALLLTPLSRGPPVLV